MEKRVQPITNIHKYIALFIGTILSIRVNDRANAPEANKVMYFSAVSQNLCKLKK